MGRTVWCDKCGAPFGETEDINQLIVSHSLSQGAAIGETFLLEFCKDHVNEVKDYLRGFFNEGNQFPKDS